MTGLRSYTTLDPNIWRFPRWKDGVFYPAGSFVGVSVPNIVDSESVIFAYYVNVIDVDADNKTNSAGTVISGGGSWAPNDSDSDWNNHSIYASNPWALAFDTTVNSLVATINSNIAALSSLIPLVGIDSDIGILYGNDSDFRIVHANLDSDIVEAVHNAAADDSDIYTELARIDHDILANDSDLWNKTKITNTYYVNDNVQTISEVFEKIGVSQAKEVILTAGSHGGALVLNNVQNNAVTGPVTVSGGPICQITDTVTIQGASSTRVRFSNVQFVSRVTINGTLGRHYFKDCVFLGGIEFTGTMTNWVTFEDCNFSGGLIVPATFGGIQYHVRSAMESGAITLNQTSPLQIIFTESNGFTAFPTNATFVSNNYLSTGVATFTYNGRNIFADIDSDRLMEIHDRKAGDSDKAYLLNGRINADSDRLTRFIKVWQERDSDIVEKFTQYDSEIYSLRAIVASVDSDWILRQIVATSLDSDWVLRNTGTGSVDSDWVLRQIIATSLDSDWVLRNTGIGTVDSDWVLRQTPKVPADSDWIIRQIVHEDNYVAFTYAPTSDVASGGTYNTSLTLSNYQEKDVYLNGVLVTQWTAAGTTFTFNFFLRANTDVVIMKLRK